MTAPAGSSSASRAGPRTIISMPARRWSEPARRPARRAQHRRRCCTGTSGRPAATRRSSATRTRPRAASRRSTLRGAIYYLTDADNNVTALVGINPNTGDWQVVERYVFDAYGTATIYVQSLTDPSDQNWTTASTASSVGNTILFASETLDPATGLYCDGVRWYDASMGTFVSRDPLGLSAGSNTYQYCGSDPISNTDPSGMDNTYSQNVDARTWDYPNMSLADPSFSDSSVGTQAHRQLPRPTMEIQNGEFGDGGQVIGRLRARRWRFRTASSATAARSSPASPDDGDSERRVRRRRLDHQPASRRRWRFRTATSATAGDWSTSLAVFSGTARPIPRATASVSGSRRTAQLVRSWGGGRFEEHTLYCEVHLGPGAGRPQQAGWSLNDPYLMLCHPFATIGGAGLGLCHGAAMIANAATFHQITALNLYVQTIVTQNGGMYGVANFFAHVGVYSGYAAIGLSVMGVDVCLSNTC